MKIHVLRSLCRRRGDRIGPEDNGEEAKEDRASKPQRASRSGRLRKRVASVLGSEENRASCACCLKPLAPTSRAVRCQDCGAAACQNNCSRLDHQLGWCCLFCYQQRTWLRTNSARWINVIGSLEIHSDCASDLATPRSPTDLPRGDKAADDAKSAAYTAIRRLVDHAVDEVQRLENSSSGDAAHHDFSSSRKNQDSLLATVIVNKVIAKCRSEQGNASVLNFKRADNNDFFEAAESSRIDGQSQSCDRSLESFAESLRRVSVASKFTQTQPSELSSLMYEERIEEVAAYISEKYATSASCDELDFCDSHRVPFPELGIDIASHVQEDAETSASAKSRSLPHSWKENWYFRKRSSAAAKPAVSMFVPNSNADYRALIGDRDVDETSELSEHSTYGSSPSADEADDVEATPTAMKNSLATAQCNGVASRSATSPRRAAARSIASAGCKTPAEEDKLFSLAENTPGEISRLVLAAATRAAGHSSSLSPTGDDDEIPGAAEPRAEFQVEPDNSEPAKEEEEEEEEDLQRDRECEEHNTLVPRRFRCGGARADDVIASRTASGATPDDGLMEMKKLDDYAIKSDDGARAERNGRPEVDDDLIEDFNLFAPPIPGSIADREHKKWQNAVPIENNPYSLENIHKRLVQRHNPPTPSVLSSYGDTTISGSDAAGFHALAEDKATSAERLGDGISESKEKIENVSDDDDAAAEASEALHKTTTSDDNNDRAPSAAADEAPSSPIIPDSPIGRAKKTGLSNTQLIRSYFENGERRENTRDASPKKARNIDGKLIRSKATGRRHQESAEARRKNSRASSESLLPEPTLTSAAAAAAADDGEDKITLPSVKKIVQAFNEKSCSSALPRRAASNKSEPSESEVEQQQAEPSSSSSSGDGSARVVIRRTPKQLHLHSLTARSLSREFREGLRQVPRKA